MLPSTGKHIFHFALLWCFLLHLRGISVALVPPAPTADGGCEVPCEPAEVEGRFRHTANTYSSREPGCEPKKLTL